MCDVINYCASSFAMGKIKCIWSNRNLKREKKREISNNFYTNFHLKDDLRIEFIV